MKIVCKDYEVKTTKVITDKNILTLSDLHISKSLTNKKIDDLLKRIMEKFPDYIFILGDIIPYYSLQDKETKEKTFQILKLISEITKTYMVFGNNDYLTKHSNIFVSTERLIDIYQNTGINILNNSLIEENDINIVGYNKSPKLYIEELRKIDNLKKELESFISSIKETLNKEKYTILLTHSHLDFLKLNLNFLETFDLILAGHTHNTMVPEFLEPFYPPNKGFYLKQKLFEDNVRGQIQNENANIIVSGGLTKISDSYFNKFIRQISELIYPAEITNVKIKSIKK